MAGYRDTCGVAIPMMVFLIVVNLAWPYGNGMGGYSTDVDWPYGYPAGTVTPWIRANAMADCQKLAALMTDTNRLAYCVGPQFK